MDKKKSEKREIVGVYLLFIIGLVGCIFCIFNEINKQKEFENSTDIRSVSAVITQAKEDKESSRIIKYDVDYSYEVEGETYKGRGTVYHRVKIGDEDTITVYRTSKGKYKIEPIDSPIEILIATIGAVLCTFILVAMTVGRILEKRDKEKNEESNNKGKKSKKKY